MIVAFELSMPGRNSWNGKWSSEERFYVIVRNCGKRPPMLGYYSYDFGDGWRAGVTAREVDSATARKMRKQSAGFCGYDWMVDSIVRDGDIYSKLRPKPLC